MAIEKCDHLSPAGCEVHFRDLHLIGEEFLQNHGLEVFERMIGRKPLRVRGRLDGCVPGK